MERIKYLVNILIVALLLATVALQREGRLLGYDVADIFVEGAEGAEQELPIETTLPDGTRVIHSASLAKDVVGFGGRTPIQLHLRDGVIERVVAEPNSESPSFFGVVERSGLLERWSGMSLEEAATAPVDAISGATYSSKAIIANVQRAAQWGANVEPEANSPLSGLGVREVAGLLVILLGVFITLKRAKSKWLMRIQLILNVAVLGFWCGAFLSLSTLTTWMSSGVNLSLAWVSFAMLVVVVVMPLLGRRGSYCHLHCPMGSAQELLWMIPCFRIKINPRWVKRLQRLRYYLLMGLLMMMWLGVGFEWMDYEIFSAFIFTSASTAVLVMAGLFLTLSLFIYRPYCRFICPTGALITMAQKTKE